MQVIQLKDIISFDFGFTDLLTDHLGRTVQYYETIKNWVDQGGTFKNKIILLENCDFNHLRCENQKTKKIEFGKLKLLLPKISKQFHLIQQYKNSHTCSYCDKEYVNKYQDQSSDNLSIRVFRCRSCGLIIKRDINAALNVLKKFSIREMVNNDNTTLVKQVLTHIESFPVINFEPQVYVRKTKCEKNELVFQDPNFKWGKIK